MDKNDLCAAAKDLIQYTLDEIEARDKKAKQEQEDKAEAEKKKNQKMKNWMGILEGILIAGALWFIYQAIQPIVQSLGL